MTKQEQKQIPYGDDKQTCKGQCGDGFRGKSHCFATLGELKIKTLETKNYSKTERTLVALHGTSWGFLNLYASSTLGISPGTRKAGVPRKINEEKQR
jgi:hypothetical protein